MKRTIQNRITTVLMTAFILMSIMGSLSLYYFSKISSDINKIIITDLQTERNLSKVKSIIMDLNSLTKAYLSSFRQGGAALDIKRLLTELRKTTDDFDGDKDSRDPIDKIREKISSFEANLAQINDTLDEAGLAGIDKTLNRLGEAMLSEVSVLLEKRYEEIDKHRNEVEILISNAHRNMLLILGLCLSGGIIILVLAPTQVTAPFKRYIHAIDEIAELKFETRLPVRGDDEVATLGHSINALIDRLMVFDEMKQKRIQFERARQRVLANMIDQGVMFLSIEGGVVFMNAQLANILRLDSENYQDQDYHQIALPMELKEMIEEVIRTKEKSDSRMMILNYLSADIEEEKAIEVLVDVGLVRNYQGDVVNIIVTFEDITNSKTSSLFKRIAVNSQNFK